MSIIPLDIIFLQYGFQKKIIGIHIKLYLNGKLIASGTSRGAGPKNWRGAKFYVGGSMTNLASLTGWVDEVQIWSKALTTAEVQEAMKGYATAPANPEKAGFKFIHQITIQRLKNIYAKYKIYK